MSAGFVFGFAFAALAVGSYSPPLTRVRIDHDTTTHTPSLLYATDHRVGSLLNTELHAYGAQYIFQKEWASGFGLQIGAAAAIAQLEAGFQGNLATDEGQGYLLGGQLRAYAMLSSGAWLSSDRDSALTAFLNLRGVYYSADGTRNEGSFEASFHNLSGGAGLMAELAVSEYLSICPYAWFSPGFQQRTHYKVSEFGEARPVSERSGFSLRQPLRAGLDVWIYFLGKGSDAHLALSAIASLIDTEGEGNQETAFVLSYTF